MKGIIVAVHCRLHFQAISRTCHGPWVIPDPPRSTMFLPKRAVLVARKRNVSILHYPMMDTETLSLQTPPGEEIFWPKDLPRNPIESVSALLAVHTMMYKPTINANPPSILRISTGIIYAFHNRLQNPISISFEVESIFHFKSIHNNYEIKFVEKNNSFLMILDFCESAACITRLSTYREPFYNSYNYWTQGFLTVISSISEPTTSRRGK